MASPTLITGFEQGFIGASGELYPDVFTGAGGALSMVSTGQHAGSYALRIETTSTTASRGDVGWLGSGVGIPANVAVLAFAFKIEQLPQGATVPTIMDLGESSYVHLNVDSTGQITVAIGGGTEQDGPVITDNDWHLFQCRFTRTGNPWTCDWNIDGVDYTQATLGAAGSVAVMELFFEVWIGGTEAGTEAIVLYDDVVVSGTSGDYPLVPSGAVDDLAVVALVPDGDGTHGTPTSFQHTGDSFTGSANLANGGTSWQRVDEVPWVTSDTDYIRQNAANTARYAEHTLSAPPGDIDSVIGAMLYQWMRGATATGCNWRSALELGGTATTAVSFTIATAGRVVTRSAHATKPGGGAWTDTDLASARVRSGFSSDVSPNPWMSAVMLEVAYIVAAGGNPVAADALIAASSTVTVAVSRTRSVDAAVAASSTVVAAPRATRRIAPLVAATSAVTAAPRATRRLAASIAASSAVSAAVSRTVSIAAAVAASSTVAAVVKRARGVSPAIAASSTVAAVLRAARRVTPTVAASSAVTVATRRTRRIAATIAAVSTVTVETVAGQIVFLVASIAGSSTVAAAVKRTRRVEAAVAGSSTVAAFLRATRRVAPAVAASSTVAAAVRRGRSFQAAIAASSSVSAVVRRRVNLRPAVAAASTVAAVVRRTRGVAVVVAASSTVAVIASGGITAVGRFLRRAFAGGAARGGTTTFASGDDRGAPSTFTGGGERGGASGFGSGADRPSEGEFAAGDGDRESGSFLP